MRCKIKPVQQQIIWKWPKCLEEQLCKGQWPLNSKTLHPDSKVFINRFSAFAICSTTTDKTTIFPPEWSDRRPACLQGRQSWCKKLSPPTSTPPQLQHPLWKTHTLASNIPYSNSAPCSITLSNIWTPVFSVETPRERACVFLTAQTTALLQRGAELILSREERESLEEQRINFLSEMPVGRRRGGVARDNARQATYSGPFQACSAQTRDEKLYWRLCRDRHHFLCVLAAGTGAATKHVSSLVHAGSNIFFFHI